MEKLTKSMPLFKERNCSVSIVLDSRTRRKNAYEFPLSLRFTIDRKFFYLTVGSSFILQSEVLLARKSSQTSAMQPNARVRTTNFKKSGKIPLSLNTRKF